MPAAGQLLLTATPTPLGVPVTIVNVTSALGAPGTIVFRRAAPAATRTVPLAGVIWSPLALTCPVPADLPAGSSAESWEIVVTNGAGTAFDPLPVTVASGAPAGAKVLTVGGGPANLGAPVTVLPVAGTFGSATSTTGTVTLTRDANVVAIPPERVLWTALGVTFSVPGDLPTTPAPETWQVTVQPTGGPVCGPYPLPVLAMPAIVFVPPTSVSERRLDLVTVGTGANTVVRFYDRSGRLIPHNIPPARRTPTGLAVQMPTLREVMASGTSDLDLNQLTMRLRVTVYDPDSGRESPQTDAHSTIMAVPPPAVGPVKAASAAGRLVLGEANRPAELGDQLSLEWIGARERGKVTFHPLDIRLLDALADARLGIAQAVNPSDPDLSLAPGSDLTEKLRTLRAAGQQPKSIVAWGEERIEVEVPEGWTSGAVIVWRDDLPSPAVVLPGLPIPDLCRPGALRSALGSLVGLAAPTLVQPGDLIELRSVKLADPEAGSLPHLLLNALKDGAHTVEFTLRLAGAPTSAGTVVPAAIDFPNPTSTLVGDLRIKPEVVSLEAGDAAGRASVTATLEATVTGVCPTPMTVLVDTLEIVQLPVRIPTVVAGFDHRAWRGDLSADDAFKYPTIVFVREGLGIQGAVDRGEDQTQMEWAKARVLAPLEAAYKVLHELAGEGPAPPFPDILGAGHLEWLKYFINKIAATPANDIVVTAQDSRGNLDFDPGWWNKISSLCMFGVGDGVHSPTLKLFEGNDGHNHQFHVRMPAGFVVASYWTLHESAFKPDFVSPPAIPAPGPAQEGRAEDYPKNGDAPYFGNVIKSFEWS